MASSDPDAAPPPSSQSPVVISTWSHGRAANEAAWAVLSDGGPALDAVEAGVAVSEADPDVRTVGRGGYPDEEGVVTVDASIMDHTGQCGAVAAVEDLLHPTAVARAVMEETPHVMLAGEGARTFALDRGFETADLLTEASRRDWEEWRQSAGDRRRPEANIEEASQGHDTIGMLALDESGRLAGACTTSGTAWKMHGRVGDSPLIGAGLYVDGAVGAACATGWGEAIIRSAGSHLAVEAMRHGASPQEACCDVVERVDALHDDPSDVQVGVLALDVDGRIGACSWTSGFETARYTRDDGNQMVEAQTIRGGE
mgnify:CR=1 FL=1